MKSSPFVSSIDIGHGLLSVEPLSNYPQLARIARAKSSLISKRYSISPSKTYSLSLKQYAGNIDRHLRTFVSLSSLSTATMSSSFFVIVSDLNMARLNSPTRALSSRGWRIYSSTSASAIVPLTASFGISSIVSVSCS